jgi:hypothetical protein
MRIFRSFANVQQPLFEGADTGGGGGGGFTGPGAGGGQGGGGFTGPGTQTGQGGGQSTGGSSPVSLSDDTQITHDGKTMSWKDYRSNNFVPKSDYDNVKQLTRREIENNLRTLAKNLNQRPQQTQQQPQQRTDPFASVRGLPIVDGDTVAQLAENGFGQIGQTLQQQQQVIAKLSQQLQKLQGGVGTLAKERSGQERTSRVSQALSSLGEGYDVKDPFLQEIAQDVLDAWEFEKPEEFPQMVQQRIQAAEKFFRARDKQRLEAAKNRRFVRPGGGASPSGGPRVPQKDFAQHASNILFGNANS